MKKLLITFLSILFTSFFFAQSGSLIGTVYDGEYNDVLSFASVVVTNSNAGTTSDFEGKYAFDLEAGVYSITFSFVGYQSQVVENVEIKANQDTNLDITLQISSATLDEVFITTTTRKRSEQAVLNLQKNSVNTFDGLSLEGVKRTGASNVASAVKTVPGVSLEDGKFVYVRGLGDRYTKSILNGMDIPGLDPDRNTVQLDIFPSNLIENIIVYKTLTADLPADFTGGVVDIVTRDFSNREEYSINFGVGYNPDMHFNDEFITQNRSKTDILGYDNGLREDPIPTGIRLPRPFENNPELTEFTSRFNPEMGARTATSLMNSNWGFNTSNQINIGKNKLGYIGGIGYDYEVKLYDDYTQNFLFKPQQLNEFELVPNRLQKGFLSEENVLINGLLGLTYKRDFAKYKILFTRIQNGTTKTGEFEQESFVTNAATFFSDNLEYTQKAVSNLLLSGNHVFSAESNIDVDWKISGTRVKVEDKDVRSTLFEFDDGAFIIRPSIGEPRRIWRNLEEDNLSSKLDFTYKHKLFNRESKLKMGVAGVYKIRNFDINQYTIRISGEPALPFNGDPNQLLTPENLWRVDNSGGTYITSNFEPANTFEAYNTTLAAYISEEFKITDNLKTVLGVRFEKFDNYYTGANTIGDINFDEEKIIDEADIFPSANLIYSLNEKSNLRLSYARSTARPSFKEASIAQIFDPITNITFNGNIDLQPSYIDNFDIRYEVYSDNAGLIAVSGFYKKFDNPIELTIFGLQAINDVIPRNIGEADIFGAEVELRRNLEFIAPGLSNFSINTNFSIIESEQTMSEAEFEGRLSAAREGENIDNTRQLQGQAPFLVNGGLTYQSETNGIQSGLYYNVQGETLEIVGIGQVSDVFSDPFHSLNFNIGKSFGQNRGQTVTLQVNNLLDDERQSFYQSFGAKDQIFSNFSPGTEISLKYSMSF